MLVSPAELPSMEYEDVTFDTETTGLDFMKDKPFLAQIGIQGKVYSVRWTDTLVDYLNHNLHKALVVGGHNIKYDIHMLYQGGVSPDTMKNTTWECSMVNAALINEWEKSFSLDSLATKYTGRGKTKDILGKLAEIFGGAPGKHQMGNLHKAPINIVVEYGEDDVIATAGLRAWQRKEIARQGLQSIVELESRVIPVLARMERRGVLVDEEARVKAATQFDLSIAQNNAAIKAMVGREVNTLSTPQMTEAFMKLGIPLPKVGEKLSFAKDLLTQIEHPFSKLVLINRSLRKMQETFVTGLEPHIKNGHVHTNFNQLRGDEYGVVTGRLSSSQPNMQQIPKRNAEAAAIVRGLFIPEQDGEWICADWSQFEFRIFGHYVKDENVIKRYRDDPHTDFHQACADLTGVPRNPYAKQINLGLVFGMGEGKLAKLLGLPFTVSYKNGKEILIPGDEAKEIFSKYHASLPNARAFLNQAQNVARERGFVKTLLGRYLRFPEGNFTHKAGGLVFQGTAADLMKRKLVEIEDALKGEDAQLRLVVHDEFDVTCHKSITTDVERKITEIMENIPELRIPIIAETGVGPNWWEASK